MTLNITHSNRMILKKLILTQTEKHIVTENDINTVTQTVLQTENNTRCAAQSE